MTVDRELLTAAATGDRDAAEELVRQNTGLIWSVARRFFGRGVDADDLYQLGCVGFIKAVKGFDPQYGTQFSTYAVPKITGEIRRYLRDDGSIKVSRGVKERVQRIKSARLELEQRLGREPTVTELSAAVELTPEDIAFCESAAAPADSLQRETGEEGMTLEQSIGDDGMEDRLIERVALREAVNSLPEKERATILLRYYRGLTQQSCAKIIGVSQVQVSRLERRALSRLREMIL